MIDSDSMYPWIHDDVGREPHLQAVSWLLVPVDDVVRLERRHLEERRGAVEVAVQEQHRTDEKRVKRGAAAAVEMWREEPPDAHDVRLLVF